MFQTCCPAAAKPSPAPQQKSRCLHNTLLLGRYGGEGCVEVAVGGDGLLQATLLLCMEGRGGRGGREGEGGRGGEWGEGKPKVAR